MDVISLFPYIANTYVTYRINVILDNMCGNGQREFLPPSGR